MSQRALIAGFAGGFPAEHLVESGDAVLECSPDCKQDPIGDVTRLVRLTGWHPTVPLKQTVSDTLSWWRRRLAGDEKGDG